MCPDRRLKAVTFIFPVYQFCFNRLINIKVMTVFPKQLFCRCWNTNMEKRAVITFHPKIGKKASETFWLMQQVYGDDCLNIANVFLWLERFLEGRERWEDDNREGRLISARTSKMIEKVRDFVENDRNASLKIMEEALSGHTSVNFSENRFFLLEI